MRAGLVVFAAKGKAQRRFIQGPECGKLYATKAGGQRPDNRREGEE
jgi:hypothetical protein